MSNIQKQHKISPAIAWLTIQKFIIFYCPLDGEHTTEFLRDYNFVKEYGEGVDRMCRELEAAGLQSPEYRVNAFMLQKVHYTMEIIEPEVQLRSCINWNLSSL